MNISLTQTGGMTLFMSFIAYAVIGWLWETVYCSLKAKRFVYRGFLLGPYCPVYGFGVCAVLLLVPKESGTLLNLYFNVVVIVTIIEYIASVLLEKLFNMTLWNYESVPLNIEGRVAVPVSLFWGIGCIFLIKIINPVVQQGISWFDEKTQGIGPILILLLFLLDGVSTFYFSEKSKEYTQTQLAENTVSSVVKETRWHNIFEKREHHSHQVLRELLAKEKKVGLHLKNLRRVVNNYPNARFKKRNKR